MNSFFSLRIRLVATVFVAIAPALALMYFTGLEWMGFLVGLLALAAAWYGGERFVLRKVRVLYDATQRLARGDLNSRTGLGDPRSELGQLAQTFDNMAETLQKRMRESESAEKNLLNRALQQTVVAALGQFALVSNDLSALFTQAVTMVTQTLDVEFCEVSELQPDGEKLVLRMGAGWKKEVLGQTIMATDRTTQPGYTLGSGEPVVVEDLRKEKRFQPMPLLLENGVISSVTVAISTRQTPFGVLGAHSSRSRKFTGDEVHFLLSVATALGMAVERNRAEAELKKLAVFAQFNPNPAMELDPNGNITYFNDAALRLAISVNRETPRSVLPPQVKQIVDECLATGKSRTRLETVIENRTLSWSFHPVADNQIVHCYVEDITDRLSLEAQLRQSQKMESIGQLAAGVAHDFNNMLTIIQGHAGILMAKGQLTPRMHDSAQAIHFASERAASLTRQLLLFGRKNVMQIRPLDLRTVVTNLTKLLKRSLGEVITLEFTPPDDLPRVNADNGMVEQVIMNLCVNARDAMPKGGTLTISLDDVQISEDYVQSHPLARAGQFVRLCVSDTGTGMDAATINRIFEPFFTTKEIGKGTGLGLATVYGIVKQHQGWIEVASEPGHGSTFAVFLQVSEAAAQAPTGDTSVAVAVRGGDETILIVEDEVVLRDMAHSILEECGYKILHAGNGREAVDVATKHPENIDLLLTDVVMPEGLSGVELATKLLVLRPQMRVVFTSGYTVEDLSTEFLQKHGARFLQKPYNRISLAHTVRQTLDGRGRKQSVSEFAAGTGQS